MTVYDLTDPCHAEQQAEADIQHYLDLLAGDGLTNEDVRTATHYLRLAARTRMAARALLAQQEGKHAEDYQFVSAEL